MLASFLITFREGLEAFLIVGIILSYLGQLKATQYSKYIYLGVTIGIFVSLFIAYVFQVVLYAMDNELYQHYLMIVILLFATVVLSYMVIWMAQQSKQIKNEMQNNLKKLVNTSNIIGMVFLAFLAVLREGFETVLFFSSLSISQDISLEDSLIGAFLGLISSLILVYFLMKGTKNIPISTFFKYTGLLILIIASGLFASAVSMMQASHLIPTFIPMIYDISFILDDRGLVGTFLRALFGYNSSPTLLHFIAWSTFLFCSLFLWKRSYTYV